MRLGKDIQYLKIFKKHKKKFKNIKIQKKYKIQNPKKYIDKGKPTLKKPYNVNIKLQWETCH